MRPSSQTSAVTCVSFTFKKSSTLQPYFPICLAIERVDHVQRPFAPRQAVQRKKGLSLPASWGTNGQSAAFAAAGLCRPVACSLLMQERRERRKRERERELGSARDRQTPHLQGVHKWFWRQIYQFLLIFNRSIVRKKSLNSLLFFETP